MLTLLLPDWKFVPGYEHQLMGKWRNTEFFFVILENLLLGKTFVIGAVTFHQFKRILKLAYTICFKKWELLKSEPF